MINTTPRHVQRPQRWYLPRHRLTNAQIFAAALIVFAIIMAWGELQIVDQNQATHRLATRADQLGRSNTQLIQQIQDLQLSGRKTRDDLQHRTDVSIAALWCTLVSQTPDNPSKPIIHQVRVKYHCPPFNPKDVGHLPTPPGSSLSAPAPGGAGGGGAQSASTPPAHHVQPSVQPRPSGRPAPTSPSPRPTSTPTVPTPTQQPSPPQPVIPVGEVLCRLLGVCLTR